jgi:hypothetical protein
MKPLVVALSDLPPSLSAMGELWSDEANPGGACFRLETKRCYRRELCAGKKGGLKVGKTKRGKGTKIMAVADRHGLPVSICIEAPHRMMRSWPLPP